MTTENLTLPDNHPDNPEPHSADADNDLVRKERSELRQQWGDKQALETKRWLYEGGDTPRRHDARYHCNVALALFVDGKNEEAHAHLNQALQVDPRWSNAYNLRSQLNRFSGRYDESVADANQALELTKDPRHANPLQKGAEASYVELRGLHADAYFQRGRTSRIKLDFRNAVADYERALEVQPENLQILAELENLLRTCPDPRIRDMNRAAEYKARLEKLRTGQDVEEP
jgi:tetratricopeptide (TPR) repeat protein